MVIFFFFCACLYQNAKKHGKHSKWENKTQPETCILSVFELHTYQTAKTHEKETQQFSQKTCILRFLSSLRTKNAKIHAKYTIWENENKLREKCIMSVFELLRYQNVKTYE